MGQGHSEPEACHPSCLDSDVDNLSVAGLSQDFQKDGLPVIPECEVFHEGGPDALELHKNCQKNPGHANFIPVKELTIKHLPPGHRTTDVMDQIKHQSDKTVKVTVSYTSPTRPDTYPNSTARYPYSDIKGSLHTIRCGTGVFMLGPVKKEGPCPCHLCKRSKKPEGNYLLGVVSTASHVIFDEMEARFSMFEMFYDSEDSYNDVKCLYGVGLLKDNFCSQTNREENGSEGIDDDSRNGIDDGSSADVSGCAGGSYHGDEECMGVIKRCHQDRIWVLCASHDLQLVEMINKKKKMLCKTRVSLPRKYGVILSHPHGLSKHVSFGSILQHRYPLSPSQTTDIPYSFGPGVKCRLGNQCKNLTSTVAALRITQSFQKFLRSDVPPKLGMEYTLKYRISILVPSNAVFLSESVFQKGCANYWVSFHPGTKFALQTRGGKDLTYHVLPNAEFNFFDADFNFYTGLSYATYAIDTCPGCSGAEVLFTEIKEFHGQHSGALKDGTNRSALDFY